MLTGARSPQDLPGGDAAEGKGAEKWGEGSCAWLTAEGVSLQRTQERKGLMWKTGFLAVFVCVWCRQSAVLFFSVWCPVFPAPFIEGTVLSPVYVLGSFLVN